MNKAILIIILFLQSANSFSQGGFFLNQKICDSTSSIFYSDLVQRPDGSFYACGYTMVDAGSAHQIPFLVKYDWNFNEVYRKVYYASTNRADQFLNLKLLQNGNLLVLANLESNDGEFAGLDTNTLSCGRILIAELDTLGNFIHSKSYSYCGQTIPTDITLDTKGNIYVCGHTISQMFDFSANPEGGLETNAFLIRLDTLFNSKWLEILDAPGSQDIEPHLCVNSKDEVLFTTSSIDQGGYFMATMPTSTGYIYVSCIDSSKNLKWQKCYGSLTNGVGTDLGEFPMQIIYDSVSKDILIAGICTSKDGDMKDTLDKYLFPTFMSYILRLDSAGNKIWNHKYGPFSSTNPMVGKIPYSASYSKSLLLKDNYIYLLNEVMYTDSTWTGVAVNNDQQTDQWLLKIDNLGIVKNKLRIGGEYREEFSWVKSNLLNDNIFIGMRSASTNCYPGKLGSYVIYECGIWPSNIQHLMDEKSEISLVPNPCNSDCNVSFQSPTKEIFMFQLFNLYGVELLKNFIKPNSSFFNFNTQNLESGIYIIRLNSISKSYTLKLNKF